MDKPAKCKCKLCGSPFVRSYKNQKYCKVETCVSNRFRGYWMKYYPKRKKREIVPDSVLVCDRHVFDKGKCIVCGETK